MLDAFIPIVPYPKRTGTFVRRTGKFFANKKTKEFEKQVSTYLYNNYPEFELIINKPIFADILFCMPRPKTVSRNAHTVKPDRSNLLKSFEDAMEGVIYKGDQQIIGGSTMKVYADSVESVGIYVKIYIAGSE